MKRSFGVPALSVVLMLALCGAAPVYGVSLPSTFIALSQSPALNNPGLILVDLKSNETVYSSGADETRSPASVMKLVSAVSVLRAFGPEKKFSTSISATEKPNKFLLIGGGDPWLAVDAKSALANKRAFLPSLINKAIESNPGLKAISLQYKNIYYQDIQSLQNYFKGKIKIYPHLVAGNPSTENIPLAQIESPKMSEIINFTLLWSDNLLAARLSFMAAKEEGFTADSDGLQNSFLKLFSELNIQSDGLVVKDGAGLSHDSRISARTIAELLIRIRNDPTLEIIYESLPLAGMTGTLRHRFLKDAPSAVGLVKAKTGWINTTVSLAGYVTVGEGDYVFAVIADHIANAESSRQKARVAIDKMLATIAKPPSPVMPPPLPAPTDTPDPLPTNDYTSG